jgi:hypothetical protein
LSGGSGNRGQQRHGERQSQRVQRIADRIHDVGSCA